ncbi:glycosyltransferase [Butyrivibrio sp. DSM 10294]|uniref:glycosyltransferase n=1 Tax=Butyrivibrio sp. DSM 10294 TaxID=2972457 RepID=UPI00234F1634|nr:glycosyltransferase [Butyrivibrio sp. DSM 10294]MDC7293576.1 glycosyltransferase [Butyrivibrio sp. DSM 10294]
MRAKVQLNEKPIIDILIATAANGGVENCINLTGRFLTEKGFNVRVIQLVFRGYEWADPCMEFHYLIMDNESHKLQIFIDKYESFLKDNRKPDVVLATCWPLMSHVAKTVTTHLNLETIVASWLHAPVNRYDAAGYGGIEQLKLADVHFAISDEIADSIYNAYPDSYIYRINNPVDKSKIHKVTSLGKQTLLFVGRLSAEKNIPIILRALSLTKERWFLKLVGEGDELLKCKALSEELGISEHVEFLGWSDDPWKYADGATALVLSSMYEGSPLVAIEALSCGLPVIANVSSRVSEIIVPGENGYLYPDNDSENLAKILDMIADNSFPSVSSEVCSGSVKFYDGNIALFDFYSKIHATVNGRIIEKLLCKRSKTIIDNVKISIIIPCYNAESYIERCLDSIINQTIGIAHIEIIVVNDASTDSSLSILTKYEEEYPENICIINLEENSGQGIARNIGIDYATGDYVMYVDADDAIHTCLLEKLYIIHQCYPVNVVMCDFETFSDTLPEKAEYSELKCAIDTIEDTDDMQRLFLENAFLTGPWAKLYVRDFLIKNPDIRFMECYKMEDIYFTYLVLAHVRSWLHVSMKGYYYFENNEGTMRSEKIKDYYMHVFVVFEKAVEQLKQLGFYDSCKNEIAFVYIKKVFSPLISYMKKNIIPYPVENEKILKDYLLNMFPDITYNKYLTAEELDDITGYL